MVDKGDFVYHGDHLICPQGTPRQGPASLSFPTTDWLSRVNYSCRFIVD